MISGMGFYYPMGMAAHNGKIYAGQLGSYGIKSIDHDTGKLNTSFGTKGSWRRPSGAHSNCTPYYPSTLTIDNGNLYVLSFALHPTRDEPTGTLNFSRILYKTLRLTLVDESKYTNNNYKPTLLFNYYSSYYNILVIKDGLGGLMYQ